MNQIDVTAPGRNLHARFVSLGNMTGKTVDEIIAAVGPPSSRSSMPFGQMLMQWQATGCHMALLFGPDGRFVKITHEYAGYAPAPPAPAGCMGALVTLIILIAMLTLTIRAFG
jgi:hypothetical protein